jgi:hypothetical protein
MSKKRNLNNSYPIYVENLFFLLKEAELGINLGPKLKKNQLVKTKPVSAKIVKIQSNSI